MNGSPSVSFQFCILDDDIKIETMMNIPNEKRKKKLEKRMQTSIVAAITTCFCMLGTTTEHAYWDSGHLSIRASSRFLDQESRILNNAVFDNMGTHSSSSS